MDPARSGFQILTRTAHVYIFINASCVKRCLSVQVGYPISDEHTNIVFGLFPFVLKIQAYWRAQINTFFIYRSYINLYFVSKIILICPAGEPHGRLSATLPTWLPGGRINHTAQDARRVLPRLSRLRSKLTFRAESYILCTAGAAPMARLGRRQS